MDSLPVKIFRAKKNREQLESCFAIARGLPGHFDASALTAMAGDLTEGYLYLAHSENRIKGFASIRPGKGESAELAWMAVDARDQGRGIGTALLDEVSALLLVEGFRVLCVNLIFSGADLFFVNRGFKPPVIGETGLIPERGKISFLYVKKLICKHNYSADHKEKGIGS